MGVISRYQNLLTTSGLSILKHGIISTPDVTLCDKNTYVPPYSTIYMSTKLFVVGTPTNHLNETPKANVKTDG